MRPRMPSRRRSWYSPAGPTDSGCGTHWVRGSIGHVTAACAREAAGAAAAARAAGRCVGGIAQSPLGGPPEVPDDLGDVLHREVNRLPQGLPAAVVLCYFEGLSPEQAARQLGCPSERSRPAGAGPRRLRSHLTRRGLAPAVRALGTVGVAHAAAAPSSAAGRAGGGDDPGHAAAHGGGRGGFGSGHWAHSRSAEIHVLCSSCGLWRPPSSRSASWRRRPGPGGQRRRLRHHRRISTRSGPNWGHKLPAARANRAPKQRGPGSRRSHLDRYRPRRESPT